MSEETQKIVYIFTAAGDRAEDAVTGFTLANVALSMENEVTIILLGYGTLLAKKGYAETVHAPKRMPLKELMDSILSSGGKIVCCIPCVKGRTMSADDFVEGAQEVTAVGINELIMDADKVVSF
jgi:predicted peroxiredoxin